MFAISFTAFKLSLVCDYITDVSYSFLIIKKTFETWAVCCVFGIGIFKLISFSNDLIKANFRFHKRNTSKETFSLIYIEESTFTIA